MTARMMDAGAYVPYEHLVSEAAAVTGLPPEAPSELFLRWQEMEPWPDAVALRRLTLPYAFVTNCSAELADFAARRSGTDPRFALSAEEAGRYKPHPAIYLDACRRLGTAPERTLFVAGSPYDARGAGGAGLVAALVVRRSDHRLADADIPVATSLHDVVDAIDGTA